jgi:hypothetical protein
LFILGGRASRREGSLLLLGEFFDVEVVFGIGDFYLFFDEALVDKTVKRIDNTPAQYRLIDPAQ